ncbi:MAG TPA: peptide chain release factor 2, partial [Longilinea sp.]|nr:peptide chain release factor 2 [Longilinea sp.]
QKLMKSLTDLRNEVESWHTIQDRISETIELAELDDPAMKDDIEVETQKIEAEVQSREFDILLGGKYDQGNAFLEISSGAGGTESNDWAAMLERMYLRWTERRGYATEIISLTEGEEAGIKSVVIAVNGRYAYGRLRAEKGVHRLVRLSPFDANHRRHTSFAMVEVLPEAASEDLEVQINPDDLKVDIYRSSGAGGQNVQKNSTAIRITHIPTGIVVSCQNERSQLQNRENAMRVLRARLLEIYQSEQDKELSKLRGEYQKTEFGSQIRSYVLHPYHMVKDHRTDYETGNSQAVLDGDIDPFIEAFLRFRGKEE